MAKATAKTKATKTTKKASKPKAKAKAKAKTATKTKTTKTTKKKASSRPAAKAKAAAKASKAELEKLNETGRRKEQAPSQDRRKETAPVQNERRKAHRRRQIDPTTCEREYKEAEIEFMHALDEYKRVSGRMFPTCSEILEVLMKMGYRQVAEPQELYNPNADKAVSQEDDEDDQDVEIEDSSLDAM